MKYINILLSALLFSTALLYAEPITLQYKGKSLEIGTVEISSGIITVSIDKKFKKDVYITALQELVRKNIEVNDISNKYRQSVQSFINILKKQGLMK